MKLRLSDDSLRLRLSPAEVAQLAQTGLVRSETALTQSSVLIYELITCDNIPATVVTFESQKIRIAIPSQCASRWTGSQEVGIYVSQIIDAGRSLKIMVEKDFECLDPAGNEPGSILYPNPHKAPVLAVIASFLLLLIADSRPKAVTDLHWMLSCHFASCIR